MAYLVKTLDVAEGNQLVMCSSGSAMQQFCDAQGVGYRTYNKRGGVDVAAAWKLKKLCKQFRPHLIHLHDAHAHTMAWLSAAIFGNRTPLILSRRVDFPVKDNWFSKRKYNHAAIKRILCVSDTIRKITAPAIQEPEKLCTVYSGVDLNRFANLTNEGRLRSEFKLEPEKVLIGNTSAIADHKDYFTFVDTAERLVAESPHYVFFIIGDGPDRAAIEQYISNKGLSEKVLLTGFRKDVLLLLKELDVFLMTSKTEGLGTSLLDAMACKTPIVATAAGGIPELIQDGLTGLLAPVGNTKELAKQVRRVVTDHALAQEVVNNASRRVIDFSKERTATETMLVYLDVLREEGRKNK